MGWIINIIFLISCYPILFIFYMMLKNAADHNSYCFGATLKKELRKDEEVKAIDAEYKKNLKRSTIVLAIIPIPFFFIPSFSIGISLWMIWILAICFIPMSYFAIANRKIIDLKQERGWDEKSSISYADLKIASVPRKVKLTTFLPELVLSTIPVVIAFILFQGYGYEMFGWIVAIFGLCTYLFYACAIWTDKQKITVICDDSDTNMNFARAKKQIWKNFWVACAWINTVFTWFILLVVWQRELAMSGIIWGSLIYCVVIIIISIWLIKKIFDINKKYDEKKTIADAADDDKNWLWGMMYYNKNDKHFMIENRLGTGTSVNLANKAGMATTIFSIVALLSIPILCIWMIMSEFTPIRTSIENEMIICEHLSVEYEIPLIEIDEYSTLTELPKVMRVKGTGMDNLLSGTFEINQEEMAEIFLNPQNQLFIKLVVDEQVYYISGVDDIETEDIIDQIEAVVK